MTERIRNVSEQALIDAASGGEQPWYRRRGSKAGSLKSVAFRQFLVGSTVGAVGNWSLQLAQSLLNLELSSGNAAWLGLTVAVQFLPLMLFSGIIGMLADKWGSRRLLLAGQVTLVATVLAEAVMLTTGHMTLELAFVFAALFGLGLAVQQTLTNVFVLDLVPRTILMNAVSVSALAQQIARFAGPALAGVLISEVGYATAFYLIAVSFGVFAVSLARLSDTKAEKEDEAGTEAGSAFQAVLRDPRVLEAFLLAIVGGLVGPNFGTLATLVLRDEFNQPASAVGLALSILSLGTFLGVACIARLTEPSLQVVRTGAALMAGSAVLGGLAWNPMVYGFSLFPAGVGALLLTSQAAVVVQTSVHPSIRGRVSAIYTPALLIGVPIGAPLIGLIAEATSPRLTSLIWGAAGLTALIGVVLLLRWRAQPTPQTPL